MAIYYSPEYVFTLTSRLLKRKVGNNYTVKHFKCFPIQVYTKSIEYCPFGKLYRGLPDDATHQISELYALCHY